MKKTVYAAVFLLTGSIGAGVIDGYIMSCVSGDARNCDKVGLMYTEPRKGVDRNVSAGMAYFNKACRMQYADGCFHMAKLYDRGKLVTRDKLNAGMYYRRALRYYEKGCKNDNGRACLRLGLMYAESNGVKEDMKKANILFKRACELGNVDGCSVYDMLHKDKPFGMK